MRPLACYYYALSLIVFVFGGGSTLATDCRRRRRQLRQAGLRIRHMSVTWSYRMTLSLCSHGCFVFVPLFLVRSYDREIRIRIHIRDFVSLVTTRVDALIHTSFNYQLLSLPHKTLSIPPSKSPSTERNIVASCCARNRSATYLHFYAVRRALSRVSIASCLSRLASLFLMPKRLSETLTENN